MAELATIARPYAQALWQALADRGGQGEAGRFEEILGLLSDVVSVPAVRQAVTDPRLSREQVYDLIAASLGEGLPAEIPGFLRVLVDNRRLEALPGIAEQFHALRNASEGVADAYIETAFPLEDGQAERLLARLIRKFPGLKKLNPVVTVNRDLIGGVRIRVGDKVLDGTVVARLAQLQAALTA